MNTNPLEENLFSLSELYHENSKMGMNDNEFYAWINQVNTSGAIRNVIAKPNYQYKGFKHIDFPGEMKVEEEKQHFYNAIKNRRSIRDYVNEPITKDLLFKLLFVANGVSCEMKYDDGSIWKMRTTPSPGGLFPVELFCAIQNVTGIDPGLYLFSPTENRLYELYSCTREDLVERLSKTMRPMKKSIADAAITVILSCNMPRIKFKYRERAYRFALLETGHIAQNLILGAEVEQLGAVCIGGFLDNDLNEIIRADGLENIAQYCITIGNISKKQSGIS